MKQLIFPAVLLLFISALSLKAQWVHSSGGMYNLNVYALAANNDKIFAGTQEALSVSTNNGLSWSLTAFNSQIEPVHSLFVFNHNIYAGVKDFGVSVSVNNGGYWTFHHPLGNRTIYSLTYSSGNLFAGASAMNPGSGESGVYLSVDNGYSFTQTTLINKTVYSLAFNNNILFAGTAGEGVYITSNNGVNWTQTSLINQYVKSLAANNNIIFAGTLSNGVYISTNNGSSWTQSSLNNQDINALAVIGNNVFAGTSSATNFFVSANNGASWNLRNEGLGNFAVSSVCVINNFIFAGTGAGVYRRPLGELVGVQPISNEIPNEFLLYQNYPNPFNPTTKIKFEIPNPKSETNSKTEIRIYDIQGKVIEILVNEIINPGTYEIEWNASKYSSGVYYYKMVSRQAGSSTGDYVNVKKMILVK